jgi:hypothetical protein
VRRTIPLNLAAFSAFVNYHKSFLCINLGKNGLHLSAARIVAVAGVYINVERPQAKRAVIS